VTQVVLGTLTPVEPREVWKHEATVFTPWLLDNADRLGDALGIELELSDREHPVGGYALDLVGHDLTHGGVLIVENQLEGTNHGHLGQLVTYAAGTGAATVVWVATSFREEHRQALDWLNANTVEDVRFFGVRVRVVRIGDSMNAPMFELVAQPNDWQKTIRAVSRTGSADGKGEVYRRFWARYLERVRADHPGWTSAKSAPAKNWMSQPTSGPGGISPSFATGSRLRHELYIDTGDADANTAALAHFRAHRAAMEAAYGQELQFEELVGKRACKIADYRADAEVADTDRHDEYIDWLVDAGVRLRAALATVPPPLTGYHEEG